MELGLLFEISESENNKFVCTMDVPMQGAKDIPASGISIKGKELSIDFDALKGKYIGTLSENKNSINGTWTQNGQSFELLLNRIDQEETLLRPL
ncbi:MAG: hypothetical protein ACI8YQ_004875 [Polaribacter sp.]|jgi:hypothetical protein